jgi:hypothetical protein
MLRLPLFVACVQVIEERESTKNTGRRIFGDIAFKTRGAHRSGKTTVPSKSRRAPECDNYSTTDLSTTVPVLHTAPITTKGSPDALD